MSEQPPSASDEALNIIDGLKIFPGPAVIAEDSRDEGAEAIDALIAQRVKAETTTLRDAVVFALHWISSAPQYRPVSNDDRNAALSALRAALDSAPAERPAPPQQKPKLNELLAGHTPAMNRGEAWPDAQQDSLRQHRCSEASAPEPEQPGCGDPLFGSVLSMMIRRQFQRVDGRAAPHGRYYTECRFCSGTDIERPPALRTSTTLVMHDEDCALAKYLPMLRAMAVPPTDASDAAPAPRRDVT